MARWLLVAFVLALLPVVAVVMHPELRQVITQDVILLFGIAPPLYALPNDSPQRQQILHLEKLRDEEGVRQRIQAYTRMAKETRQPYLYAAAIRAAMQFSLVRRPLAIDGLSGPMEPKPPSPEMERKRRQVAQEVLSLSEQMILLDPNNAFPHLTKMCALFALKQDELALKSLQDAAACAHYVEYELAWARLLVPQGLTAEERVLLLASIVFPHLSQFREAMRYVAALAEQSEQKGDHARALALRQMVASVGAKMRDSNGSIIPALVGMFIQETAWARKQKEALLREGDAVHRIGVLASAFASYARQHGRPDLAEEALRQATQSQNLKQRMQTYVRENEVMEVAWLAPQRRVLSVRAAGIMLLLWSFAMAFLLGASLVFSPLWRQSAAREDRTAPLAAALVVAGAFVAVALGGYFALDGFGSLWAGWIKDLLSGERIPSLLLRDSDLQVFHASTCAVMGLLAAVCFVPSLVRTSKAGQASLGWLVAMGLLLGLALVSSGAILDHERSGYEIVIGMLAIGAAVTGVAAVVATPFYAFVWHKPLPQLFRAGLAALWGLTSVVAWMGWLSWTSIWLMAGLFLWLMWGRGSSIEARAETQYATSRFGMSALILAVFGLWLYAILGYASLPARAQQHAYIDQLIEHGEMSLLQGGQ